MKLPWSWLKELVDVDESIKAIADRLTMIGLEVEAIEGSHNFDRVVVGEVLSVDKHPNADKLHITKVNVGVKDPLQIVCGANNLSVGIKVPVVLIGGRVGDFEIKKANLRGKDSHGMICSEKELGLGADHEGIMILDPRARVGSDFAEYIGNEKVIDVSVLANRPDCMGMWGLASEVAAATDKKLKLPQIKLNEEKNIQVGDLVRVEVKDKDLCPRYMARLVKDVKIGKSPKWLQDKLLAFGIRPINNVVDISNYVMLETAQPLHFFDYNKLAKTTNKADIIIRRAKEGEKIVTLDGVSRKLSEDTLVIADKDKAIALAGVMGSANSEITDKTDTVLIEAAIFDKTNIRKTSRKLGLRSEAVARFEKGVPNMLPEVAINRAAQLLAELASGKVSTGWVDAQAEKQKIHIINLDIHKAERFLGVKIGEKESLEILERLGFEIKKKNGCFDVTAPWWRVDIKEEQDLYEEIIRIYGYEKIPSTLPTMTDKIIQRNKKLDNINKLRTLLSDLGLTEVLTYPFVTEKDLKVSGSETQKAPKVANPLVKEQEYLRANLFSSMLISLSSNQFLEENISIFEIGRGFELTKPKQLPKETQYIELGFIGGHSWPIKYPGHEAYYKAKGVVERLFREIRITGISEFKPVNDSRFVEGTGASVLVKNIEVGRIGEVDNKISDEYDLKRKAVICELNLDLILSLSDKVEGYTEIGKYPKTTRDISVIFPSDVLASEVLKSLGKIDSLIRKVEIIDIYTGKPLEKGMKSISIRLSIMSLEKTLTDQELEKVVVKCHNKLKEMGGSIRGDSK